MERVEILRGPAGHPVRPQCHRWRHQLPDRACPSYEEPNPGSWISNTGTTTHHAGRRACSTIPFGETAGIAGGRVQARPRRLHSRTRAYGQVGTPTVRHHARVSTRMSMAATSHRCSATFSLGASRTAATSGCSIACFRGRRRPGRGSATQVCVLNIPFPQRGMQAADEFGFESNRILELPPAASSAVLAGALPFGRGRFRPRLIYAFPRPPLWTASAQTAHGLRAASTKTTKTCGLAGSDLRV